MFRLGSLILWAVYIPVFNSLHTEAGSSVGALVLVPVATTAWGWGMWGGAWGSLLGSVLNALLFSANGEAATSMAGVVVPAAATLFVGGFVGYVRLLRDQLHEQKLVVRYQAEHDHLTGLLNRRVLTERLEAIIEANPKLVGIFYIDLDGFKSVNDTLGHGAGDEVLRLVSGRLSSCLRNTDLVARIGGDEFIVVAEHLECAEDAVKVATKIISAITGVESTSHDGACVTCSIGLSLYPVDGRDPQRLLNRADNALNRAKQSGKNRFCLFDSKLDREPSRKHRLLSDLHRGVEHGEFELHYQPQIELATGEVTGFEALLRWNHPQHGELSPTSFLPLAEGSGAIVRIGEWAIREACRQVTEWRKLGHGDLRVGVNVSAVQLNDPKFPALVRQALEDSGLPAECLELEITETMVLNDVEQVVRIMLDLRQLGVRWALDDFGTGYSSLKYLRQLPLQTLKIDRSFITDLSVGETERGESAAIVRAVAGLAQSLGMKVVAEGVETEEQLTLIEAAGSNYAQGFLLTAPLKAPVVVRWLMQWRLSEVEEGGGSKDTSGRALKC